MEKDFENIRNAHLRLTPRLSIQVNTCCRDCSVHISMGQPSRSLGLFKEEWLILDGISSQKCDYDDYEEEHDDVF